jgi:hypothetical protein
MATNPELRFGDPSISQIATGSFHIYGIAFINKWRNASHGLAKGIMSQSVMNGRVIHAGEKLRHLGIATFKDSGHPIGMRQPGIGKRPNFTVDSVVDAADFCL